MSPNVKPIPDNFRTLTPHIVVKDARKAMEFYKKAFGAENLGIMDGPDGKVMHASMKIGDSIFMLNDEYPEMGAKSPLSFGGTAVTLHMYVEDADRVWKQAVGAGAKVTMPIENTFWGDRYGVIEDPYGHSWSIATHKEDLTPAQMAERQKAAFSEKK